LQSPPIPDLFTRLPAGLFGPLTGPLAPLYWALLARFYQYEFEREPLPLVKPTAVEVAEQLLRQSSLWAERREELLSLEAEEGPSEEPSLQDEAAQARAAARRLVSRLEQAGWFHFEYRRLHGQVLSFHPYAARLLDTLVLVARDKQPVFQGYAHSIATLLKPDSFAARPGVSLSEARRNTLELVRELKILNRNIFIFIQRMIDEVSTAAGVLEEGIDHYREAVQANYHRLKTVENLYRWRSDILLRLDAIERDPALLEAAGRWYAEQLQVDPRQGQEQATEDLRLLRMHFDTLPEITQDIDERNARFSGVALRKLMYLLRQDQRTEGQLQYLVEQLSREDAPELEFDVYRCELLGGNFLYTPPGRRPRPAPQPLAARARDVPEALRRALAERLRRPYARARIEQYVHELLGTRASMSSSELPLEGDEDYVRAIYLMAYGLDGGGSYRFRPQLEGDCTVRKGLYTIPEGRIERTRRRG
jgi:hypothetical protein